MIILVVGDQKFRNHIYNSMYDVDYDNLIYFSDIPNIESLNMKRFNYSELVNLDIESIGGLSYFPTLVLDNADEYLLGDNFRDIDKVKKILDYYSDKITLFFIGVSSISGSWFFNCFNDRIATFIQPEYELSNGEKSLLGRR